MNVETERLIFIFLGMAAVTYFPRLIPLVALSRIELPRVIMRWLAYLPVAILSALIFPGAIQRAGAIDVSLGNPGIWALLVSFGVAIKTRNLILTVVVGGVVMYLLQLI